MDREKKMKNRKQLQAEAKVLIMKIDSLLQITGSKFIYTT